jgi:hypothetical protein
MRDDGEYVMHFGEEEIEKVKYLDGGDDAPLDEWEIHKRIWRWRRRQALRTSSMERASMRTLTQRAVRSTCRSSTPIWLIAIVVVHERVLRMPLAPRTRAVALSWLALTGCQYEEIESVYWIPQIGSR